MISKPVRAILTIVLVATLGLSSTGCGAIQALVAPAAASAKVSEEEVTLRFLATAAQKGINADLKNDETFSSASVQADPPKTLVLTMILKKQVPTKLARQGMKSNKSELKPMAKEIQAAMKEAGIKKGQVRFVFRNADGSKIWSHTFKS